MTDDLVKRLEALASYAERANHWTDTTRYMDASGVADTVYDALDRIEELGAKLAWQPVETAPKNERVLVTDGQYVCSGWHVYDDQWMEGSSPSITATHWMPLPRPPDGG